MPGHTNLYRRGSSYYFRARVPADLLEGFGKAEIKESLRTHDRREAVKLVRARAAEWERELQFARQQIEAAASPSPLLTNDALQRMARRVGEEKRQELDRWIAETQPDPHAAEVVLGHMMDEWVDSLRTYRGQPTGESLSPKIRSEIRYQLHDAGYFVPEDVDTFERVHRWVASAVTDAIRWAERRARGDYKAPPLSLAPEESSRRTPPQTGAPTIAELIDAYEADPARANLSKKTLDGYAVIFRALRELIGEGKSAASVTRADLRELRSVLMRLPPNAAKRFKGKTLRKVAELGEQRGLPPISNGTVNSYLNNLSALFKWAVREQYLPTNPAEGLTVAPDKHPKDKRDPFSIHQLNAIFQAPLYTGCIDDQRNYAIPGPNHPRRGRFWIPLLSLWTGMRLNECAQLGVADIQELDGVSCILIREDPDGGDEADRKRVKTAAGERFIPIHPELLRIGFLQHLATQKRRGSVRLFPELKAGKNGYYSDPYSKWFSRFLRSANAKTRKTSFHSFRHNYRDALREAGISRDAVLALGGWNAGGGSEEIYGAGLRPKTLYRMISTLRYDGLDLAHLYLRQE